MEFRREGAEKEPKEQATVRRAAPASLAEHGSNDTLVTRVCFAPIVRVNGSQREVELCATSEAIDDHGTIFDYQASKDAFTRWIGNVREMHERRAVGRRVAVRFDDQQRKVFVRVHISQGAENTWQKILDGTLRGASIGASNVLWQRQVRRSAGRERRLNVATHYDLVELSLVDNPSNPDALGVTIVRDATPNLALLAPLAIDVADENDNSLAVAGVSKDAAQPPSLWSEEEMPAASAECLGRQWSAQHKRVVYALPDHQPSSLQGRGREAKEEYYTDEAALPQARGSEANEIAVEVQSSPVTSHKEVDVESVRAQGAFSTNAEGYPDTGVPVQAEARPTAELGMQPDGNMRERLHAAAQGILAACSCPSCLGAIELLGETGTSAEMRDNRQSATPAAETTRESEQALARAVAVGLRASTAQLERMDAGMQGLRALLGAAVNQMSGTVGDMKIRLDALEAQPMPGGPVARAVEKTLALATQGTHSATSAEQLRALEGLAGRLHDPQAQIAVAAELIRLQREG